MLSNDDGCNETRLLKEKITIKQQELNHMVETYGIDFSLHLSQEIDKLLVEYYNSRKAKAGCIIK